MLIHTVWNEKLPCYGHTTTTNWQPKKKQKFRITTITTNIPQITLTTTSTNQYDTNRFLTIHYHLKASQSTADILHISHQKP